MRREDLLEQEYRKMMTQAAPDLWSRIEEGLKDHPERAEMSSMEAEKETGDASGLKSSGAEGQIVRKLENREAGSAWEFADRENEAKTVRKLENCRTESGAMQEPENREGRTVSPRQSKIRRLPVSRLYGAAAAAAACLVFLVIAPRFLRGGADSSLPGAWNTLLGNQMMTTDKTAMESAGAEAAEQEMWEEEAAVSSELSGGAAAGAVTQQETMAVVTQQETMAAAAELSPARPDAGAGGSMADTNQSTAAAQPAGASQSTAATQPTGASQSASTSQSTAAQPTGASQSSVTTQSAATQQTEETVSFQAPEAGKEQQPGLNAAEANGDVYDRLTQVAYRSMKLPEGAVTADMEYFTEHALAGTELFCQVTVETADFGRGGDGRISQIVYKAAVDQVYWTDGENGAGDRIVIRSPIVSDGNTPACTMHQLQEGSVYLVPLKACDGGWELVFPYAPQIQRTEDGGYLFHSGYYNLVGEGTAIVPGVQEGPNDYYYDRMFLREDDGFLSDLTALVESEASGRSEE